MIFFIIGVLAALVALAVLLLSEEGKAAAFIPGVVAVIMIGVSCVSYVPHRLHRHCDHVRQSRRWHKGRWCGGQVTVAVYRQDG